MRNVKSGNTHRRVKFSTAEKSEVEEQQVVRHRTASAHRVSGKAATTENQYEPLDWDDSLPYGGKVYLARRKKPDSWKCVFIQGLAVVACLSLAVWCYFYFDHFHYHVVKMYAHLGHSEAQHLTGQRFLHGRSVVKDHKEAMKWFRRAADGGHAHASYNLVVGHLQGLTDQVKSGEVRTLLRHAARNGVDEAHHVLNTACVRGDCT